MTSVLVPCLPRPVALQAAGGGMTLPLRKTMTNLTSVTVSTAGATFLPRPCSAAPSRCFPGCGTPSLRLPGSSSWACIPACTPAPSAKAPPPLAAAAATRPPRRPPAFGARLLSLAAPARWLSSDARSLSLSLSPEDSSSISFSVSESYKQMHNSKSADKGTWLLWLFMFPFHFLLSLSCPR